MQRLDYLYLMHLFKTFVHHLFRNPSEDIASIKMWLSTTGLLWAAAGLPASPLPICWKPAAGDLIAGWCQLQLLSLSHLELNAGAPVEVKMPRMLGLPASLSEAENPHCSCSRETICPIISSSGRSPLIGAAPIIMHLGGFCSDKEQSMRTRGSQRRGKQLLSSPSLTGISLIGLLFTSPLWKLGSSAVVKNGDSFLDNLYHNQSKMFDQRTHRLEADERDAENVHAQKCTGL